MSKGGAVMCDLCNKGIRSRSDLDVLMYNRLGRTPKPFHKKCAQKVINEAFAKGEGKSVAYTDNNRIALLMTGMIIAMIVFFFVVVPSWDREITPYGWLIFAFLMMAFGLVVFTRLYSFFSYENKLR